MKKCRGCGTEFDPPNHRYNYCEPCRKNRAAAVKVNRAARTKPCIHCGTIAVARTINSYAICKTCALERERRINLEIERERRKRDEWSRMYQRYRDSRGWKRKQQERLRASSAKCDRCSAPANTVHHLTYDRVDFDHPGTEPLEDLQALCKRCHYLAHHNLSWHFIFDTPTKGNDDEQTESVADFPDAV